MTGPGMSAILPAGRSFQRWMPNAASTVGASRTPSRIIASAPFEIPSAGPEAVVRGGVLAEPTRSAEHTSELESLTHIVYRLLLGISEREHLPGCPVLHHDGH